MCGTIIYRMSSEVKAKSKTSKLWKYFKPVDDHFAICNMCSQKLSYKTSTSNLKKHMESKHPNTKLLKNHENRKAQVCLIMCL